MAVNTSLLPQPTRNNHIIVHNDTKNYEKLRLQSLMGLQCRFCTDCYDGVPAMSLYANDDALSLVKQSNRLRQLNVCGVFASDRQMRYETYERRPWFQFKNRLTVEGYIKISKYNLKSSTYKVRSLHFYVFIDRYIGIHTLWVMTPTQPFHNNAVKYWPIFFKMLSIN